MQYSKLKELVGRDGFIPVTGDLEMRVTITDVRILYGRKDVLIRPWHYRGGCGRGEAWVTLSSLDLSRRPGDEEGDDEQESA